MMVVIMKENIVAKVILMASNPFVLLSLMSMRRSLITYLMLVGEDFSKDNDKKTRQCN